MNRARVAGVGLGVAVAAVLVALGLSIVGGQTPDDERLIQLRVWQRVDDPEELWLSIREAGGRWDEVGTFRLTNASDSGPRHSPTADYPVTVEADEVVLQYGGPGIHPGRHLAYWSGSRLLQRFDLRIWQRLGDPNLIWIELLRGNNDRPSHPWWSPLGVTPLALDDGFSSRGHYRYGNLEIISALGAGLRTDREHLLAMRDVVEGAGAELNWRFDRPTREWDGVAVGGEPARVTGLDLSDRGLSGEIWGWLGELDELTELRLEGNSLTGMIPSKLELLSRLRLLRLAGNPLSGCIPSPLREVEDHDLDSLALADCPPPTRLGRDSSGGLWTDIPAGTFWLDRIGSPFDKYSFYLRGQYFAFDVPPELTVSVSLAGCLSADFDDEDLWTAWDRSCGYVLHDAADNNTWVYLREESAFELERSHYSGCVYDCLADKSPAAIVEQLAASAYVINTKTDERVLYP